MQANVFPTLPLVGDRDIWFAYLQGYDLARKKKIEGYDLVRSKPTSTAII